MSQSPHRPITFQVANKRWVCLCPCGWDTGDIDYKRERDANDVWWCDHYLPISGRSCES